MSLQNMPVKVKYSLFFAFIFLCISIRYPQVSHEFGVDSFFIHAMAQSLNDNGYGPWLIHWSSYFGLYPFSYPSGAPFILSTFSQLSGLSIENSILILSFFFGILSFFSAYMFASLFIKNDLIKMFAGLLYSTTPVIIKFTYWTFSARGILLALTPLILWIVLKPYIDHDFFVESVKKSTSIKIALKFLFLGILFIIAGFTIHYSAWIILGLVITFILIICIFKITKYFFNKFQFNKPIPIFHTLFIISLILFGLIITYLINPDFTFIRSGFNFPLSYSIWILLGFLIMTITIYNTNERLDNNKYLISRNSKIMFIILLIILLIGAFLHPVASIQNSKIIEWMTVEGIEYSPQEYEALNTKDIFFDFITILVGRYGLLLIMALIGLFVIIISQTKSPRSIKLWFLILTALLILPLLSLAPYPVEFYTIMISIMGCYSIDFILKGFKRIRFDNFGKIIIILFISAVLAFSSFTITYRINNKYESTGDRNYLDEELIELSIFVKHTIGNNSFRDPDHIQTTRISALTGKESIYYHSHDFQYMIWRDIDFLNYSVKRRTISTESFSELLKMLYRPYKLSCRFPLPDKEYYISLENDTYQDNRSEYYEITKKYYRVYSNDRITVWLMRDDFDQIAGYNNF